VSQLLVISTAPVPNATAAAYLDAPAAGDANSAELR
jgi:hypothetical protein